MSNDLMDRLRRENPVPEDLPILPIEPVLRRLDEAPAALPDRTSATRGRARRAIGGLPVALSVIVAFTVAAVVITTGRHTQSPQTPPQRHTSLDQLLARFAVLRRPQTQADRSWVPSGQAGSARHYARVISRYTRLATTLSDGERLFLTVEQTQVEQNGQAPGSYLLNLWVVKNGRIVGGESYSPDVGDYTSTPGPLAWLDHRETWSSIMPDGVTSVRWIFPRENGLRTHIYPRALTVDVPVVGNVAATRVARSATWDPAVVILYGAHHQPLKTFRSGNPDRVS